MFAGSEAGAKRHRTAILCSLVQTCKHLQINPFIYLRDVIERVSTHPARLVLELTPREWKRLRQQLRRPSRRLNGGLLIIRPRLRPVSSISIYVSIALPPTTFFVIDRWTVEMELVTLLTPKHTSAASWAA